MTPMRPLPIGVVGCGRLARLVQFDALAAAPGVEVAALADPDPAARAAAAARFPRARVFGGADELFAAR